MTGAALSTGLERSAWAGLLAWQAEVFGHAGPRFHDRRNTLDTLGLDGVRGAVLETGWLGPVGSERQVHLRGAAF